MSSNLKRVVSARPRAARAEHRFEWLADWLGDDPGFECRAWFGGRSLMLDGKHRLYLSDQGEPWQGVLVCTSQADHASLLAEFAALQPHPVIRKWLYLPESADTFEHDAKRLVTLARARDPRIGVAPTPRKKRRAETVRIRFGDVL
jgi:hypothetical protein